MPRELFPDGNAILNTAQQVSVAFATALTTTFLSAGVSAYLIHRSRTAAVTNGVRCGFVFTVV
ncbi:hypothetical protein [Caldifermentibacillus hisashii]|uniref:hypothetical protein n=1 Tax=Caldifermentibacillus hisashii TaxID=996558 RepID=UPI0034D5E6A4